MSRKRNKKKDNDSFIEEKEINKQDDNNRWENSSYLEGLRNNIDDSKTKLFESEPEQRVPDDIEEKPDVIYNEKAQILIGDNKGIYAKSDNPLIYGEFDENNDESDEVNEEPVDIKKLSKKDYRYYLRTGRLP